MINVSPQCNAEFIIELLVGSKLKWKISHWLGQCEVGDSGVYSGTDSRGPPCPHSWAPSQDLEAGVDKRFFFSITNFRHEASRRAVLRRPRAGARP